MLFDPYQLSKCVLSSPSALRKQRSKYDFDEIERVPAV